VTLRVLLIGLGSIGQRHLQVIRTSMPQAKIMVWRHSTVLENAALADFTTSSFADVQGFQPQVAVLANPASVHAEMEKPLHAMGCQLLIEKIKQKSVQRCKGGLAMRPGVDL
jgi:predicted dehydrogenase